MNTPSQPTPSSQPSNRKAFQYVRPVRPWYENLLVAALAVLILYVIFAPLFRGRSDQARITAARTDLAALQKVLEAFSIDTGRFPTQDEGLQALVQSPDNTATWHGPYCNVIPLDPWGAPFMYVIPGVHNTATYDLWSNGPDRKPDTPDDITNW
jgi:general secretion pathway protein G